jgi:hypothetical protein
MMVEKKTDENNNRKSKSVNIAEDTNQMRCALGLIEQYLEQVSKFRRIFFQKIQHQDVGTFGAIDLVILCEIIRDAFGEKEIRQKLIPKIVKEEISLLDVRDELIKEINALCAEIKT